MRADTFLEAIRQRPEDDLPRLAYADWLDEHGEFIRMPCEPGKLPAPRSRSPAP